MIEFHRLNGKTTMNFWRPGRAKNFTDFTEGDLLFFLAKGSERGKRREKGIVGYGKFQKATALSFRQMWKEYGTDNGYSTQEELKEAILKVSKGKEMPKQINGLFLEEVTFFQTPIYLSELGVMISNKIESYIYLDKEDPQATVKLLHKAKQSGGVDMWTLAMGKEDGRDSFEEDEIKHQFSVIYKRIKDSYYTDNEKRKARKLMKEVVQAGTFEYIKGSKMDCIAYEESKVIIAIPFIFHSKDVKRKIQYLLGHCLSYRLGFKQLNKKPLGIQFKIMSGTELPEDISKIIESLNECE